MYNNNITFDVLEKIQRADRNFSLFDGCKKVLAALSGGADSCCLLLALSKLGEKYGFSLCALHVNHSIRGDEADRDESFARELCETAGCEFFCEKVDIPSLAKERGVSLELCARDVRYSLFEEYCTKYGFDAVAVAHNSGDNAETVLFNLTRGSSIKGLCGIPPKRKLGDSAKIIRPLIYVTRHEIEAFLKEEGASFVTDSTNLSDDYTRNFLRNKVIPSLRSINPSIEDAFARSSELLRKDCLFLEKLADENTTDKLEKLCVLDECILSRVIVKLFSRVSCEMPEQKHIDALCRKIYSYRDNPSLKCSLSFPGKMRAFIENGILSFTSDIRERYVFQSFSVELVQGFNVIPNTDFALFADFDGTFDFCETITHNDENIYKKYTTDYLYSDKIPLDLYARSRQNGDIIRKNGMSKAVKQLMTKHKVPTCDRYCLPIVCHEGKIALICGISASDMFSDKTNKHKISVTLYRKCNP